MTSRVLENDLFILKTDFPLSIRKRVAGLSALETDTNHSRKSLTVTLKMPEGEREPKRAEEWQKKGAYTAKPRNAPGAVFQRAFSCAAS